MTDSTVDVGRCSRNDGKGWRCKSQRFGGSSYCEKHYHYLYIKSKSRVRVSGRRAEVEGPSTADEGRCAKRNGRGWRCRSRRFGGTPYSMKLHLREASRVRVSGASASKKTKNKQSTGSTADDGRCARINGRGWRCSSPRCGSGRYCKKHYLQSLSGAGSKFNGRASLASVKEEEEVKLEEEKPEEEKPSKPKNSEGAENVSVSAASVGRKKCGRPSKSKNSERTVNVSVAGTSFGREKSGSPSKAKNLEGIEKRKRPAGRPPKKSRIELGGAEEAGRILELGQVWAFPKESDGFPRSYARIDRIIPLPLPSVVRVTPLIPHPVMDDEKLLAEQGFSLACGLFRASESTATMEISTLTHKVQLEIEGKQGSFFKIFPKEGEIWAIYLRWDALTKTFDYQLVEVESDFDEEDGVKVFAIVKVEGRDGVYRRQEYAGFHLVRSFSREFMSMFSHKVPSSRIVEGGELLWKVMLQ